MTTKARSSEINAISNIKSDPVQRINVYSDALKSSFRLRIVARMLKTIEIKGGLDAYLLDAKDDVLSQSALRIKRQIKKAASK